jgi:hypothetical protein
MKKIILILFINLTLSAQPKLLSWNLADFGSSKSDSTILFIANQIKDYDIVALQEIVVNPSGAQAVAQLADELNRTGNKWDYAISDPASSSAYKTETKQPLQSIDDIYLFEKELLETVGVYEGE